MHGGDTATVGFTVSPAWPPLFEVSDDPTR